MKIAIGMPFLEPVEIIEKKTVRFLAEDGQAMFEVSARKDGRSIEVRGVETCKVGDKLYAEALVIRPIVSNCVVIATREYDEE